MIPQKSVQKNLLWQSSVSDSASAPPTVLPPPSTPREFAREAINACFEYFWNKHNRNVQVAIFSFLLKEEIPQTQENQTVQVALERVQQEISRAVGETKFVWLRKESTTSRYSSPAFEAVFISIGYTRFLSGKKYFAIIKRLMQTGKYACCKSVSLAIPPGNQAPGSMNIRQSWNNRKIGQHWLDKLTSPFETGFAIVNIGCSKAPTPRKKQEATKATPTVARQSFRCR